MRRSRTLALLMTLAVGAGSAAVLVGRQFARAAQPKKGGGVDPAASQMLSRMTDYLAGLQSFSLQSSAVDEKAFASGEKIQRTSDSDVDVVRPNKLRSVQRGAGEGLGFWYDGKSMTIACKSANTYSTLPAPPSLDTAIDTMRKEFKIDAPGADLLYSRPYDILMEQVSAGKVIGRETVDGVAANHLAFQGDEVDWQIWIKDGPQPVPLRFVITTKTVKGHPEFAVEFSKWDTTAKIPDATFQFSPPAGATQSSSVAAGCGAFH
jgi:hypothetical protein